MNVSNIYAVGRNYKSHAEELGNPIPDSPVFFQKSSVCLSAKSQITIPGNSDFHYELEVIISIGKPGYKIPSINGLDYVNGICLGLDLTDRPYQQKLKEKRLPWFLSKSFPGSAVITQFEPPNWKKWSQNFWLTVNGKVVQKGNLDEMIFNIPVLIEFLSSRIPLVKGDIVYTGTPSGVGSLKDKDKLVLGLGQEVKGEFIVTGSGA